MSPPLTSMGINTTDIHLHNYRKIQTDKKKFGEENKVIIDSNKSEI